MHTLTIKQILFLMIVVVVVWVEEVLLAEVQVAAYLVVGQE
jgi:hypothetical protein